MISLFHVTMFDRVESIAEKGISPAFAQGKVDACWWVERIRLDWAIMHTSSRHKTPTDNLCIFQYDFPESIKELPMGGFRRFRNGIWMCFRVIVECEAKSVAQYLEDYGNGK